MTSFLYGALAGVLVGGFVGFITAGLVFTSKSDALPNQRAEDAQQPEPKLVRAARLMN
jgi:hypothetical protein